MLVLIFSTLPLFAEWAILTFFHFINIKALLENVWVYLATLLSDRSSGLVLVHRSSSLISLSCLQLLSGCWTWPLADASTFGDTRVINTLASLGNACSRRSKNSIWLILILKKRIGLDLVILDDLVYIFLILRAWVQSDHILLGNLAIAFWF